jgi:hypothetical protein
MATLRIGTRVFETDAHHVRVAAERMFRLTEAQRRHRVEAAKTELARLVDAEREERAGGAIKRAAATLLSQGIVEI